MSVCMKPFVLVVLLFALIGCDQSDKKKSDETTAKDPKQNEQAVDNANAEVKNQLSLDPQIIKKYQDKQLKVIDSSEVILDGSSTLVVTFSVPLNSKQNFTNLIRLVDKESGYVDGAWELSDNGLELRHRYLAPNRKLTLSIDKMLLAINDSRLKTVYQTELTTQDRQPVVGFASKGFLLPSKSMSGLPVVTLNVDKIDVNFFKIKPEKLLNFMSDFGLINQLSTWNSQSLKEYVDLVYSSRFDLNPKRNAQETVIINLSSINELQEEGVYIAVMNQAGSYNYSNPATLFSISNIGVSVHAYQNGKLTVLTHGLDKGEALSGIKLSLFCDKNTRSSKNPCETINGKTDKNGQAEFSLPKSSDYILLTASDGEQTSFVNLDRNALNLSDFAISGSQYYQKQLFTFGPRDLYRPEETVYLNALLRDADGNLLPDQPIKVNVLSPDGISVKEFVWKAESTQPGFYQTRFTIPDDAATGKWSFRFNLGDDDYRYFKFSVEEFLPERMAMEISVPSVTPVLPDQTVSFNVKGWYLYGAPASGNELEGNVYIKKIDSLPNLADYKIGAVTDIGIDRQMDSVQQSLDNNGITQVSVDNHNWADLRSPVEIIFQASLLDAGGRPVTRMANQTVWPAEQMPAVRALFADSPYYDWSTDRYNNVPTIDKGDTAEFDVAYVDKEGKKGATTSLKARIVRERRDFYWTWSDSEGWQSQYNLKEFTVSEEKLTIDDNSSVKVSYQPDDYGAYRIEIVDTKNNIVSSLRFWCGYNGSDNTNGSNAIRPDQVKLSLDKTAYLAGDTAKVHVQAPVAGSGYISLETNEGMLWKQNITVDQNGLDVDIPIKNWGRHDVYIHAMIVRPSTDASVQTVKRAIGLLYLPMDTTSRQLNLMIEAPQKTEPEKTVAIKVKIDPKQHLDDHKVSVLVSAVDAGVLNITHFITPDPFSQFLGRKRYNVDLYDVYGKLIEGGGRQVSQSFGGDAMLAEIANGGKKPLNDVNIVAQQLRTIELNENGEGVIELTLPDFNGELRLMAQAWDQNRFGKAEQSIVVAAPMIAELSTPRFLSGGDHAVLALDLNNLTEKSQNLSVTVSANGMIKQAQPLSTTLSLDANQRKILQLPVIADYGYGQGAITVSVKGIVLADGSDYQLYRTWNVGVRPAYAATSKNYSVSLNGGESWTFSATALNDLIDNTVDSKLVLSNQPPLNIAQYIKRLFAYPYGCLEQTISGLYPSLYANQAQLNALGIETQSDEERRDNVQIGIDRVLSMQRNNGSFGLWNRESEEEYWLTVYATDFLLQARDRGYQVNNDALDRAMNRIGQYIYDGNAFNNRQSYYSDLASDYTQFATKAYAMMILSKQNKITPAMRNEMNRLYQQVMAENKANLSSPLPLAQLALAAQLAGFDNIYSDVMPLVFKIKRQDHGEWLGDYGSEVRDQAQVLSLLIDNNLSVENQANYLITLSQLLADKQYLSTQELNALFIAAWVLESHKPTHSLTVNLNGQTITGDKSITRSLTIDDLAHGLTVANPENNEPIYMQFSLSGYGKKAPPPTADENILNIRRSYYDISGNQIEPNQLKVGDLVVALIDVSAKRPVNDALIVDFLPAGLELENQNLMNSSVNLMAMPNLAKLLDNEDNSDIKYQEYRDDRYVAAVNIHGYIGHEMYGKRVAYLARAVTSGDFVVPYPYVESMYHPEWFAIGKSLDIMSISARKAQAE